MGFLNPQTTFPQGTGSPSGVMAKPRVCSHWSARSAAVAASMLALAEATTSSPACVLTAASMSWRTESVSGSYNASCRARSSLVISVMSHMESEPTALRPNIRDMTVFHSFLSHSASVGRFLVEQEHHLVVRLHRPGDVRAR